MDHAKLKTALDKVNRTFMLEHPVPAADAIESLSRSEAVELLSQQGDDALASVWPHLSPARIDELLPELPDALLRQVLLRLDPSACALSLLPVRAEQQQRCLELLPPAVAEELRRLMSYPLGSAGRVMDCRVIKFRPDQTAAAALAQLRQLRPKHLRELFVVDEDQRLTSVVDIQDLATAPPGEPLREIARPPSATVSPFDDREEVAERLKDYHFEVLPVVDVHGRLMGAIRHAALLRALREETSADIQMMVGAGREERALSRPSLAVRKRLGWLQINLATAFLASAVVGLFESTIARFTALAVLLPVVAGQAGNSGAQALAVTMRGLALREITTRHWLNVLFKEINVGVANGAAIALTTSLCVFVWSQSAGLALVIGVAMILSMVAAGIAGSLIPITLTRLGQDPAQASSIILTTVTDVAGFLSFLGIATLLSALL
jgi:magnesium transporter